MAEPSAERNASQRVDDVLEGDHLYRTVKQLARAAGVGETTVRMLLHHLQASGELDVETSAYPFAYRRCPDAG